MTNADKIRSMTDKELAGSGALVRGGCVSIIKAWLKKQEHKENSNEL